MSTNMLTALLQFSVVIVVRLQASDYVCFRSRIPLKLTVCDIAHVHVSGADVLCYRPALRKFVHGLAQHAAVPPPTPSYHHRGHIPKQ
jgi:hypothetical protein